MNYKLSYDHETLYEVDKDVETFDIPNTVTKIYHNAFNGCKNLTTVNISNVTKIGINAFQNCISLKHIDLTNVIKIGEWAFFNCKNLNIINITNVIDYHFGVFRGCDNLSYINSQLNKDQLIYAFGSVEQYNNYCQRNRDYKLKSLTNTN